MKFCRFLYRQKILYGALLEDSLAIIPDFDFSADYSELTHYEQRIDPEIIDRFLPPVSPSKIVCVGRNYAEHARELGNQVPSEPLLFLKAPSALITDGDPILIPKQSERVEHEGELAAVIGRQCSKLSPQDDPRNYIFGLLCLNDVTARDIQRRDVQFTRAKSFDTFCPVSFYITTGLDPAAPRDVLTRVNGEVRQRGSTRQMVFPINFLIRYISHQMTLQPGDIIATGTPSGVSELKPGDRVEVDIEGLGCLQNPVISG